MTMITVCNLLHQEEGITNLEVGIMVGFGVFLLAVGCFVVFYAIVGPLPPW